MKRIAIICILTLINLSAVAQYTADGFYRVRNKGTQRYIYVCDNTGSINPATTSADMGAIQLWKDTAKYLSDPATIIYMEQQSDGSFDLRAQGTGVHQIIGYYVNVYQLSSGYYQVYAKDGSLVKYLSDNEMSDADDGLLGTERTGDYRLWSVHPMNGTTNYFGLRPAIQLNGKYYQPFYADFPFTLASTGMRAFYISNVYESAAIWTEITGVIPARTPVYIECNSPHPSGNKLTIGGSATAISGNALRGVFFCNHNRVKSRDAHTPYNAQTMRVLGTTSDGRLAWVRSNTLSYLPANQSYLPVPTTAADTLPIMTEAEYEVYSKVSALTLSPATVSMEAEETTTLQADIQPVTAVNKTLSWASSNPAVATVADGVVTATGVGSATITATTTDGTNISASSTVTVVPTAVTGVVLTPTSAQAIIGETITLNAEVIPHNATQKALTWTTDNPAVATVSDAGVVTIVGVGQTTIHATATDGSGATAGCTVTGLPVPVSAITVAATQAELHIGEQAQCTATVLPANAADKSVSWSVSDSQVLAIDENGTITAIAAGSANVVATANNGVTGMATVTVLPTQAVSIAIDADTITITIGDSYQLHAEVLPNETSNNSVVWSSASSSIATVTNGVVTTHAIGETTIYATTADGTELSDSCVVIVSAVYIPPVLTESVSLSQHAVELKVGGTTTLRATVLPTNARDKSIAWTSTDTTIVRVEAGKVTALAIGEADIVVLTTDSNATQHYSDTCHVAVVPTLVTRLMINEGAFIAMTKGDTKQLSATVSPATATNSIVSWSVSDETIATVSAEGLLQAVGVGSCYVRAASTDGTNKSDSSLVYVQDRAVDSIGFDYTDYTLSLGDTLRLEVTYYPGYARQGVYWQSSNTRVAYVDPTGKITARSVGEADIVATSSPDGKKATCHITVDPIWVELITLEADTLTLTEQAISTLKASVYPANATTQTLDWQSADANVATVSSNGRVEARFAGETYITVSATDGSLVSAECVVKVVPRGMSIGNIEAEDEAGRVFDILGRSVAQPTQRGIYIVGRKRVIVY